MATSTGAFPSRPYSSNLARPGNQYAGAAYNTSTPFQPPTAQQQQQQQQQQAAYASGAGQTQQQREAARLERERAERERLDASERAALDALSEEQRDEVNEAFALFDLDKDGHVDYHETKVAFKALGFELPKSEILAVLQAHGVPASAVHGTGTGGKAAAAALAGAQQQQQQPSFTGPTRLLLPHAAFVGEAAVRIQVRDPREEIMRAFELFDQDGKGRIDLGDLRRVARELGEGLQDEELRAMIDEFDVRGEGGIDREEFLGICMG